MRGTSTCHEKKPKTKGNHVYTYDFFDEKYQYCTLGIMQNSLSYLGAIIASQNGLKYMSPDHRQFLDKQMLRSKSDQAKAAIRERIKKHMDDVAALSMLQEVPITADNYRITKLEKETENTKRIRDVRRRAIELVINDCNARIEVLVDVLQAMNETEQAAQDFREKRPEYFYFFDEAFIPTLHSTNVAVAEHLLKLDEELDEAKVT